MCVGLINPLFSWGVKVYLGSVYNPLFNWGLKVYLGLVYIGLSAGL